MAKIARLYYEAGLNQRQISARLRLSRQKVQRLLAEARSDGIVRIAVAPIQAIHSHLERALEEKYGLQDCVVVETAAHEDQSIIAREIGFGAAEYLIRVLRPRDKVVFSWGNCLLGMVNALSASARVAMEDVEVIQGLGGLGDPTQEIHATQLVGSAARALGGREVLLPAPAVAGNAVSREAFCSDPYVEQVLEKGRGADLAFVGIGSCNAESILVPEFWNAMNSDTLDELRQSGAVGSINLHYFAQQGTEIAAAFNRNVIGLTLGELKSIQRVVAVAGGAAKIEAIRAALLGKLINVLVTDHVTAQQL